MAFVRWAVATTAFSLALLIWFVEAKRDLGEHDVTLVLERDEELAKSLKNQQKEQILQTQNLQEMANSLKKIKKKQKKKKKKKKNLQSQKLQEDRGPTTQGTQAVSKRTHLIRVESTKDFQVGMEVVIRSTTGEETNTIKDIFQPEHGDPTITLSKGLQYDHNKGFTVAKPGQKYFTLQDAVRNSDPSAPHSGQYNSGNRSTTRDKIKWSLEGARNMGRRSPVGIFNKWKRLDKMKHEMMKAEARKLAPPDKPNQLVLMQAKLAETFAFKSMTNSSASATEDDLVVTIFRYVGILIEEVFTTMTSPTRITLIIGVLLILVVAKLVYGGVGNAIYHNCACFKCFKGDDKSGDDKSEFKQTVHPGLGTLLSRFSRSEKGSKESPEKIIERYDRRIERLEKDMEEKKKMVQILSGSVDELWNSILGSYFQKAKKMRRNKMDSLMENDEEEEEEEEEKEEKEEEEEEKKEKEEEEEKREEEPEPEEEDEEENIYWPAIENMFSTYTLDSRKKGSSSTKGTPNRFSQEEEEKEMPLQDDQWQIEEEDEEEEKEEMPRQICQLQVKEEEEKEMPLPSGRFQVEEEEEEEQEMALPSGEPEQFVIHSDFHSDSDDHSSQSAEAL